MGSRIKTNRNALPYRFLLAFVICGCNDALGFQEGKPFPNLDDGAVSDASFDVSDGAPPLDSFSIDARDAADAQRMDAGSKEGGDAGCSVPACGGCIDTSSDPRNCGHDCSRLTNVATTVGVKCEGGKCIVPSSACSPGYGHCSNDPDDGCEADLRLPSHCGTCGTQCSAANPFCTTEGCKNSCPLATPTMCSGSCVDLNSDVNHCNDCMTPCLSAGVNGTRHCV
jgi:hypothetical protein